MIRSNGAGLATFDTISSNIQVTNINYSATPLANSTFFRTAAAYRLNDYAFTVNGGAVLGDSLADVPVVTTLRIGAMSNGTAAPLNGHIRRISYYPRRLSNTVLQALTSA